MDWSGCKLVEVIPGKVSGAPLIVNTRVPADLVIASKDQGETIEEIAYNYDLNPEDIRSLLAYRDSLEPALRS
ncbi:MAG TPA: DUF433 domain-containing protein [Acidobacteriaceae bacterium]|nr:DUF433 domain-containing protein [Acidobacteriaceae bacterium]